MTAEGWAAHLLAPAGARVPPLDARDASPLVAAALALGSAEAARRAAECIIPADLPPDERIACAARLAQAEHGAAALAILLADPATLGSPAADPVLTAIVRSAGLEREVAAAAWHLRRRIRRGAPAP